MGGEVNRIDRPRGYPGDDREPEVRVGAGDGPEESYLIRCSRPAAPHHEGEGAGLGAPLGLGWGGGPASGTESAAAASRCTHGLRGPVRRTRQGELSRRPRPIDMIPPQMSASASAVPIRCGMGRRSSGALRRRTESGTWAASAAMSIMKM